MGVDLALGELAGTDALVGGTVLLEASVLCVGLEAGLRKDGGRKWWLTSGLVSLRHFECGLVGWLFGWYWKCLMEL